MAQQPDSKALDPGTWEGDVAELVGHEAEIGSDEALCDHLFYSKREAFSAGAFLEARRRAADASSDRQFDPQAREEVLELIEGLAWGDIGAAVRSLEESLRRSMEATVAAFRLWENRDVGERRFGDEYSLGSSEVDGLSADWRLAYVARLLRSAALSWGVGTEFGDRSLGAWDPADQSPATLLHEIEVIAAASAERKTQQRPDLQQ